MTNRSNYHRGISSIPIIVPKGSRTDEIFEKPRMYVHEEVRMVSGCEDGHGLQHELNLKKPRLHIQARFSIGKKLHYNIFLARFSPVFFTTSAVSITPLASKRHIPLVNGLNGLNTCTHTFILPCVLTKQRVILVILNFKLDF